METGPEPSSEGRSAAPTGGTPGRAPSVLSSPGSPDLLAARTSDGTSWVGFRETLVPDYARTWRTIAYSYTFLLGGYAAAILVVRRSALGASLVLAAVTAAWVGCWLHHLWLFAHEAAHYGLTADKRRNDRWANAVIWPWFALDARGYRRLHWQHHRHLGDRDDTEISYRHCMNALYLVQLATGIALLRAVRLKQAEQQGPVDSVAEIPEPSSITPVSLIRSAALHGLLTLLPIVAGAPLLAVSWVVGTVLVYPSLNMVRQVLEHRREDVTCADDFAETEHGPTTRSFGDGIFARWFGAAGFNRHNLHHWDPTVSWTNLAEMEAFLERAGLRDDVAGQRRTYSGELLTQVRSASG